MEVLVLNVPINFENIIVIKIKNPLIVKFVCQKQEKELGKKRMNQLEDIQLCNFVIGQKNL